MGRRIRIPAEDCGSVEVKGGGKYETVGRAGDRSRLLK